MPPIARGSFFDMGPGGRRLAVVRGLTQRGVDRNVCE